jgi:hypothetical protein
MTPEQRQRYQAAKLAAETASKAEADAWKAMKSIEAEAVKGPVATHPSGTVFDLVQRIKKA